MAGIQTWDLRYGGGEQPRTWRIDPADLERVLIEIDNAVAAGGGMVVIQRTALGPVQAFVGPGVPLVIEPTQGIQAYNLNDPADEPGGFA